MVSDLNQTIWNEIRIVLCW